MANILITGANGQLGTELRNRSFSLLDDVFYTDVEELDITNFKAICAFIETHDIDTIINCAAYTAVDQAEDDEEKAMKLNRDAVANLANAAVKLDCLLVHISTDYVFDGTSDHPYTEKDATNPQSVYGRTKLEGEQAIKKSGCLYIIIRTAWLYSGYGHNFVKTISRLASERDELNVVSDQWGTLLMPEIWPRLLLALWNGMISRNWRVCITLRMKVLVRGMILPKKSWRLQGQIVK